MRRKVKTANLTKGLAEDIKEMLEDGKSVEQVYHDLNIHHQAIYSWIADAIFSPHDKRKPEIQILRDAFLNMLLGETVIAQALKVATQTQEKHSLKVTTLINLSKGEIEALEKKGHLDFIEEFEGSPVTLKVEETREMIPAQISILEKLMKFVEGDVSVDKLVNQLTPFAAPDDRLPEV